MTKNTGWAFIGTIPIVGYIIAHIAGVKDKYALFYAKQGLVLGIAVLLGQALGIFIITIPLIMIWNLVCTVLWIISAVNAFSGKEKKTPIVGKFAAKF